MVKKTAALERAWISQREQMLEERLVTQSGVQRSSDDVAIVDFDIAVMDFLIALPMGAEFDSRKVQEDMRKRLNL